MLVNRASGTTDLILPDLGGSSCLELDLDGMLLPDDPFFDPQLTEFKSLKVDLFSLGVFIYIIMTDHYPFHLGPAPQHEEKFTYGDCVRKLFAQGKFPDLSGVPFAGVITGCCCERRSDSAKDVVAAIKVEMLCSTSRESWQWIVTLARSLWVASMRV